VCAPANADGTAPDKQQCADAYVSGQVSRKASKLVAARNAFTICSNAACPMVVGHDCRKWRDELDTAIPSVVFDVRDAHGEQALGTKVELDGALFVEGLDGRAVPVDPGKHVFVFHLPGEAPIRREMNVLEGVKAQRIEVAASRLEPAERGERSGGARPVPPVVWVLGAFALGGLGGFTYFGLTANSRENDLRATCAPYCTESQREHVRALQIGADMSLVAGLVSLGLGAYFFVTRQEKHASDVSRGASPAWSF
jgi:hypothetical protein